MGIKVTHTSAYSPQSNSHAERFVRTLKNILKKCGSNISQLELDEYILACNAQVQRVGQASSLDRFFGKSILTQIPNSLNTNFNWRESMDARQLLREERVNKPQKGNKRLYKEGKSVVLQNPNTKLWDIPATITSCRTAPDGKILSYNLRQLNGHNTTRHRVFIRPALPEEEADGVIEGGVDDKAVDDKAVDDEIAEPVEPVSSRLRARTAVFSDELVEKCSREPSDQTGASHCFQDTAGDKTTQIEENMTGSSKVNCHCFLLGYSALVTLAVVALAAIIGHQGTTCIDPVICLLYTSPSPRDGLLSRMPSSA